MVNSKTKFEYIWIDNSENTKCLRSKTKILNFNDIPNLESIPLWNFDGSSTNQSKSNFSDLILKPIYFCINPIDSGYLVLCETLNTDYFPHESNTRNLCSKLFDDTNIYNPLFGLEQEYFIFDKKESIAANHLGLTPPEGRYYCGVGGNVIFGRNIAQKHLDACILANLSIEGINAEVAPGQWEFQIGILNPLQLSDEIWIARWLLDRIAENENLWINYSPKPYTNWNGSGAHLNFSFEALRNHSIQPEDFCETLSNKIQEHLNAYGYDYQKRLTGKHETCSFKEFKYGFLDRTASIRIPETKTYIEDRRPNANVDPYLATSVMMQSLKTFYSLS